VNILHLKYALEVEKTGSITRAAEHLFMGQPNLSKAIKELENSLGISIFKRSPGGVLPTREGEVFLQRAKSVLQQIEEMESLYEQDKAGKIRFSVALPRASYLVYAYTQFLNHLKRAADLDLNFIEANSIDTIHHVNRSDCNFGLIRYQAEHENYYQFLLKEKNLSSRLIWEFEACLLTSKRSPSSLHVAFSKHHLENGIELLYGDQTAPVAPADLSSTSLSDRQTKRKIYIYDRGSQFDLLNQVPGSFIWTSPMPAELLHRYQLIQYFFPLRPKKVRDVLICGKDYVFNPIDQQFLHEVEQVKQVLLEDSGGQTD